MSAAKEDDRVLVKMIQGCVLDLPGYPTVQADEEILVPPSFAANLITLGLARIVKTKKVQPAKETARQPVVTETAKLEAPPVTEEKKEEDDTNNSDTTGGAGSRSDSPQE